MEKDKKSETDIVFIIFGVIANLLYIGVIECSKKYKPLIGVYIGLIILVFFIPESLFISFLFAMIMGLAEICITWKVRQKRKYLNNIFEKMEFYAEKDKLPYYLGEKELSPYANQITFKCLIPLKKWQSEKDTLEINY